MNVFLQLFWLFAAIWAGLGNAVFFRIRLRAPIREGRISSDEANIFAVQVALAIGGPCLLFWIVQVFFAHAETPFFMIWEAPYRIVAQAVCLFIWVLGFVWVWFLGGDRKLARIYELSRYNVFLWKHPVAFRIVALLILLGGVVAFWQSDPAVDQLK